MFNVYEWDNFSVERQHSEMNIYKNECRDRHLQTRSDFEETIENSVDKAVKLVKKTVAKVSGGILSRQHQKTA